MFFLSHICMYGNWWWAKRRRKRVNVNWQAKRRLLSGRVHGIVWERLFFFFFWEGWEKKENSPDSDIENGEWDRTATLDLKKKVSCAYLNPHPFEFECTTQGAPPKKKQHTREKKGKEVLCFKGTSTRADLVFKALKKPTMCYRSNAS